MKDILQMLFDGGIYPKEAIVPDSPEYRRAHTQIASEVEHFSRTLSAEEGGRLERLAGLYGDVADMSCYAGFAYGFRLGQLLMGMPDSGWCGIVEADGERDEAGVYGAAAGGVPAAAFLCGVWLRGREKWRGFCFFWCFSVGCCGIIL